MIAPDADLEQPALLEHMEYTVQDTYTALSTAISGIYTDLAEGKPADPTVARERLKELRAWLAAMDGVLFSL